MNQRIQLVFGQIINTRFHNGPFFINRPPGGSLAVLVYRSFDFRRFIGRRILQCPSDNPLLADGQLKKQGRVLGRLVLLGQTSRSGGLLGGVPFVGRGFRNRAIGSSTSSSNASIRVQIIDLDEMEQEVLREAERRAAVQRRMDPNGPVQAQQQADFITRNIGRTRPNRKR